MTDEGDKDKENGAERPSRPVSASARRERRASARPSGKAGGDAGKRPAPKGKGGDKPEQAGQTAGKGRPTPKRDRSDEKRGSLFSRFARFIREVWAELRKVIWPTRKQMVTYTTVVLVFLVFMIALVSGLDFVFLEGMDVVFGE